MNNLKSLLARNILLLIKIKIYNQISRFLDRISQQSEQRKLSPLAYPVHK